KVKTYFDKNSGMRVEIESNVNITNTVFDHNPCQKQTNSPLKMDFCLFIKSFEYLAKKLHPDVDLDEGFTIFLEKDLSKLLVKKKALFKEKKNVTEYWNSLKREDIVKIS